jgi:shikimate kinase
MTEVLAPETRPESSDDASQYKVYLIGFSATGKSHSGRLAAQELGAMFIDMDRLIVRRAGKQISEIFEDDGEDEFRRMEREVLKEQAEASGQRVVSTGGGVPVDARNREVMTRSGLTIRLVASPETIHSRISRSTSHRTQRSSRGPAARPMLTGSGDDDTTVERVRELLADREWAYEAAADVAIDTEGRKPPDVAAEIVARVLESKSQG